MNEEIDKLAVTCKTFFDQRVLEQRREIENLKAKLKQFEPKECFLFVAYASIQSPAGHRLITSFCETEEKAKKILIEMKEEWGPYCTAERYVKKLCVMINGRVLSDNRLIFFGDFLKINNNGEPGEPYFSYVNKVLKSDQ